MNVYVHMRRPLEEDGARHREAAARQEAGGAESGELNYKLSQRRQRKRPGRVTDAQAHMGGSLSTIRTATKGTEAEPRTNVY